jgi:hypothetical protein
MIEDRLRETFDRVATGGPAEAGAFDRFQRHRRAHRSRRLAGAAALVLVAALVSAVAVPRLLSRTPERRLVVTGAGGPERWMTAPLVAVAPLQGFEVEVPVGWEANATWKGIELRPADVELRRHLDGPVQLVTSILEEFYSPAPNAWKDGSYEDRTEMPRQVTRRPEGRQSRGSFPGTAAGSGPTSRKAVGGPPSGTSPGRAPAAHGPPDRQRRQGAAARAPARLRRRPQHGAPARRRRHP